MRASYDAVTERERSTLELTNRGEEDMAGNIVHFEINAKDTNRVKKFYSSLVAVPAP